MKVIRSGDKNFEEEKTKMFEPGLTKEEQLKTIFHRTIEKSFDDDYLLRPLKDRLDIDKLTNRLFYEVKIRIKLQEAI